MSQGRASYDSRANELSATGLTLRQLIRMGHSFSGRERNCCFLNTGQSRFADISSVSGLDLPDDGRGVAVVDWDRDGDLDLWTANRSGPQLRFLRNQLRGSHNPNADLVGVQQEKTPVREGVNHFIAVKLAGTNCNRDAIGARVELYLPSKTKHIKTLHAGDGFLSQSTKWLHFGLGQESRIERIVVRWPGGGVSWTAGELLVSLDSE